MVSSIDRVYESLRKANSAAWKSADWMRDAANDCDGMHESWANEAEAIRAELLEITNRITAMKERIK